MPTRCFTLLLGSVLCLAAVLPASTVQARGYDLRRVRAMPASHWSGIVDVKLQPGTFFLVEGGKLIESGSHRALLDLGSQGLDLAGKSRWHPLFGEDIVGLREQRYQIQRACHNCDTPDLAAWVALDLRDMSILQAKALVEQINDLDSVEKALLRPIVRAPAFDISPTTQNFTADQDYVGPAPNGINVLGVRSMPGGRGQGVKVGDVENGWTLNHEDLPSCTAIATDPNAQQSSIDHGTAVLGEIFGVENGYGVTGIAPLASCYVSSHFDGQITGWPQDPAAAIANLAAVFSAGDVIVIEIHVPGPNSLDPWNSQQGYVPAEYHEPMYDAIKAATDRGIVVVAAAGNGAQDLDHPSLDGLFNRSVRDSKAIIVGAGAPSSRIGGQPRERLDFSDWGSRVDVQAWGRGVTTIGYGDLFAPNNDVRQFYTEEFSGTSSATPIVAGAVAVVQGIRKARGLAPLTGPELVTQFLRTGSPQAPGRVGHIGPLPNVGAVIDEMIVCGNGTIDAGEVCDDNNSLSGDGCSATCDSREICGNNIIDPFMGEVCDDGNTIYNDGCSSNCRSTAICGNNIVQLGEVCDDGNTVPNDGCAADCRSLEQCGNSTVEGDEVCDDGNEVSGDGCSETCRSNETCGNSYIDDVAGEMCDDGNAASGDGCSSDCRSTEECGNNLVDSGEQCDDGNLDSGDGCASNCQREKKCADGKQRAICPAVPVQPTGNTPTVEETTTTKSGCNAVPRQDMWILLAVIALCRLGRKSSSTRRR